MKWIEKAEIFAENKAVVDKDSAHTYHYLLQASASFAAKLLKGQSDLKGARVAFMVEPSFEYVAILFAIWRAGGIAVPVYLQSPAANLQYVLQDAEAKILIVHAAYKEIADNICEALGVEIFLVSDFYQSVQKTALPEVLAARPALIIYTSGTTGKPKGVLISHENLEAQVNSLISAWKWTAKDQILNVLPLHHVHGLVNALLCPLYIGACVEFIEKFSPEIIWSKFRSGNINVFMAVPTIYYKLIAYWEELDDYWKAKNKEAVAAFRLMVSGSAALLATVMSKWELISGHRLLERYGMTEIGMALSNPYDGERQPGFVGSPLPSVQVRLIDDNGKVIETDDCLGEIQVFGPTVFKEYWKRPEATHATFTNDGWFRSGDMAVRIQGAYKIMGRNSVDIIKSGGFKISALEIEEILRSHESIADCAVLGIPNEEWGELIAATIVLRKDCANNDISLELDEWLKARISSYKLPRRWLFLEELPRNALGKVNKKDLLASFV